MEKCKGRRAEKFDADNAISYWMDNVVRNCSKEEKYQETIESGRKH